MINGCWFAFKWGVAIVAVAGAAAAFYYYRHVDSEVCRLLQAKLSQHYTGLKVSVRSAQLVEGKDIRVHDLSIVEPGAEGPRAELMHIEEALLECSTGWKDLIDGTPDVRRVTVRRERCGPRVGRTAVGARASCCRRPILAIVRRRWSSRTARSRYSTRCERPPAR